jgi:steroid delta-isomerase-like uncharacterized protein
MTDNAGTASAAFDAWEKRDFDGVVKDMAEDVEVTDRSTGEKIKGRANVKAFYASWATACPDSTCGYEVVAASDDAVAIEGLWAGTNTGPFGPFEASGRSVAMPWINNLHFNGDGQITNVSVLYDQMGVLTQLGHVPLPASP